MDFVDGTDLPKYLEAFVALLTSLADQAVEHRDRAVEMMARDASEAVLALLDVLAVDVD